jgi:TetR/AcrR family transcriptional regulator
MAHFRLEWPTVIRKKGQSAPSRTESAPPSAPRRGNQTSRRRKQQRSIETRLTILESALAEFAEKGYDGASTRGIAERAQIQHPLITYHFKTKEILWRAVAVHFHAQIKTLWDEHIPRDSALTPMERVREEFRTFLRFTIEHPHFHHFMLNENRPDSPRLAWLMKNMLAENIGRVLPQIRAAQEAGELPGVEPVLIHYMLIGMTSVLSSLAPEIRKFSGLSVDDPNVLDAYWRLIETFVFNGRRYGKGALPTGSVPPQRKGRHEMAD